MEGTPSATPHLLTDVRFTVSRKGYDPDEVDNFLEKVSAAVAQLQDKLRQAQAQAETAESRAGEAGRSQSLLQSRIETLQGELDEARAAAAQAPQRDTVAEADQVSKVLVLAQRTADAAIEDANNTARATLADARSRADAMVTEAEQEAARVRADARADADEMIRRQREALAQEVAGLEELRTQLTADVAALESFLDSQRTSLREGLGRIQAVLDDPAALRVGAPPAASGASLADVPATAPTSVVVEPEPQVEPEPEPEPEPPAPAATTSVPLLGEVDPAPADEVPELAEPDVLPDEPEPSREAASTEAAEPGAGESLFSVPDPTAPAPTGPPTAQFGVFDIEAEPEADEEVLGEPDEEADAAMRAFFEAEFDDEDRYGR